MLEKRTYVKLIFESDLSIVEVTVLVMTARLLYQSITISKHKFRIRAQKYKIVCFQLYSFIVFIIVALLSKFEHDKAPLFPV